MIEYTLSWYYKEIVIRPSYSGQEIPIDQKYQQTKLLGQETTDQIILEKAHYQVSTSLCLPQE